MFKSRLHHWKFTKNSSDKEYQICAALHKIRKDTGKSDTAFVINGNTRSLRDLRKFIKGKKMSEDDFYAAAMHHVDVAKLDGKVRAVTPEPGLDGAGDAQDSDDSDPPAGASRYAKVTPSSSSNASSSPHQSSALRDALTASRSPYQHPAHHGTAPVGASSPSAQRRSSQSHPSQRHRSTNSSSSYHAYDPTSTPIQTQSIPLGAGLSAFTPDSYSTSPSNGRTSRHSSPRWSFDRGDIDRLAYSTLYSASLPQTYGVDNLDAWAAIMHSESDTSSLSDYDVICPRCHRLTSDHFSSLCNLEGGDSATHSPISVSNRLPESSTRDLFNPSPDLPVNAKHFALPTPTKQHDHSWKWVSHCFSACIYYSRERYTNHSDHNLAQMTPSATSAPSDFAFARWDLERASEEFKAMLATDDPNILIALSQTVMVLSVHNWRNISAHILSTATQGTQETLGSDHPISIMTRFVIRMASQATMYQQQVITSQTLKGVWQAFVRGWTSADGSLSIQAEGEAGRRAIPAMYCFASLLCIEAAGETDPVRRAVMLAECEYTLKNCYQLACVTFHKKHLQAIQPMVKLQLCLERQGRVADAIEWTERAVRDGEESLGKWHPRHLETKRILAELYLKDNRDDRLAEDIYWDVLEGRLYMLGRKHESTMMIKMTLEEFLMARGRWKTEGEGSCPERDRINDLWTWTDVAREDDGDGVPGDHVRTGY